MWMVDIDCGYGVVGLYFEPMTTNTHHQIDNYIHDHIDLTIERLARLCGQPSVSAQNLGIVECAQLVATMLEEAGYSAEIMPTAGHPVVYGEAKGSSDKTMLLYLHYDVQPAEPFELWDSPPFQLTRRGEHLYARGVGDDKGHIVTRLAALDAIRHVLGELPCNVKFIIEGEEEIGSPSLEAFVEEHQEKLAGDACIWECGGVDSDDRPTLALGMRGICFVELSVRTATRDLHSGMGGSIMPNAAWRLVWALSTLKDANERILIDGYYDNVAPPSARDLEMLAALPDESGRIMEMYGIRGFLKGLTGGVEWQRQAVFEPTCTICGLNSGYQGPGAKTVQPAVASAKIDFRLVPNQTPQEVVSKLRAHLDRYGFDDVEIHVYNGELPAKVDPDDPFVLLTMETAREVYGKEPVVSPLIGGSGPLHPFVHTLCVPVVSAGIGYPDGRAHAPNENVRVADLVRGIEHTARIIMGFAGG